MKVLETLNCIMTLIEKLLCMRTITEVVLFLSPEKNFSPKIVPDAIEVLLVEQDFTNGPFECTVSQVRHNVLPARVMNGTV